MADFAAARPIETEKQGAFLHDRKNRPEPATWTRSALAVRHAPIALGLLFAAGYLAIAFQTWAWWGYDRAWAVALMLPLWALGGFAGAHLAIRREWKVLTFGAPFLLIGLILLWSNIWRGSVVDGPDNGRDAMTIISAICFIVAANLDILGLVWVEARRPTRAPKLEM